MSDSNKNNLVLKSNNKILNSKELSWPLKNLFKSAQEINTSLVTSQVSLHDGSELDESFETMSVMPVTNQSMHTTENVKKGKRGRKTKSLMGTTPSNSIVIDDKQPKSPVGENRTLITMPTKASLASLTSQDSQPNSSCNINDSYDSNADICDIITAKNKKIALDEEKSATTMSKNEDIKAKNAIFLDELFTRTMSSLNKIYKEHTSCLSYMAFDNAISDNIEEFFSTNTDSENFPTVKFNPEAFRSNKIKRFPGLKSSIKARDLDKMSRLSNLIEIYNFSEIEDLMRNRKPKRHRFSNSLQYQPSSRASTSSSNNSISINNFAHSSTKSNDFNSKSVVQQATIEEENEEANDIVVVEDGTTESVTDDNNEQMDCYSVKSSQCEDEVEETVIQHPIPLPAHGEYSELIPIVATLTLKTISMEEGDRRSVALTWDLKKSDNAFLSKHDRYNKVPPEEYKNLIKEYQIFGYKETACKNTNWQMIGSIENFAPPVKCTLTDFYKDSKYHFSIRIKDTSDCYSDYSEPVTAVFKD